MRGPDPDSLTPREQEVLGLLKRGYSNRDIAQELQISLSGAKYHVSEIMSKLGVSSREEAAEWKPPASRWGFAPSSWLVGSPLNLFAKSFAAFVVVISVAASAVIALDGDDSSSPSGPLSAAAEPSPTPDPCQEEAEDVLCSPLIRERFTTWAEATAAASFSPLVPTYLPAGYEMRELTLLHPEKSGRGGNLEELWAEYYDAAGSRLLVKQGVRSSMKGFYELAPDEYRGTMRLGTAQVFWFQGFAVYEERESHQWHPNGEWDPDASDGAITLFWEDEPTGSVVWEISPDGTKRYSRSGLPIEHLVRASGLPLEELIKVAESMLAE